MDETVLGVLTTVDEADSVGRSILIDVLVSPPIVVVRNELDGVLSTLEDNVELPVEGRSPGMLVDVSSPQT